MSATDDQSLDIVVDPRTSQVLEVRFAGRALPYRVVVPTGCALYGSQARHRGIRVVRQRSSARDTNPRPRRRSRP